MLEKELLRHRPGAQHQVEAPSRERSQPAFLDIVPPQVSVDLDAEAAEVGHLNAHRAVDRHRKFACDAGVDRGGRDFSPAAAQASIPRANEGEATCHLCRRTPSTEGTAVTSRVPRLWPAPRARVTVSALALLAVALVCAFLAISHTTGSLTAAARSVRPSPVGAASATPARASTPSLTHVSSPTPASASTPTAGQRVEVIVQLKKGVPVSQGRMLVRSLGGTPGLDLPIINGLSARLSAGAQRRLAASPLVHDVSLNAPIHDTTMVNFSPWQLATTFDSSVGATRLWNHGTGSGIGVAVIDSGIRGDLPDFLTGQGESDSRVVSSAVIDPSSTTTAADTYGHGTAVAGLIAGNGGYRDPNDPLWGQYAGTAPDANLISVKVADDTGHATTLDAIYGLQFVVDHKDDYNIQVVNLSFRSTSAESYRTDPLDAAVEQAWFDGITVVAAAGNLGTAPDAVSYAPGNDPYVITVGAADDNGTPSTWDDVATSWSSQGATQDGVQKPDVLAPGAHIVSTLAPNSAFATLCPSCVTQGAYFQASGTSLAAPIVSGIVADLLTAHPDWTPDMVKAAITNTAIPLHGGGSEVRGNAAYWASGDELVSNQHLTPSQLVNPDTDEIDYSTASWSAGTWSPAADPLTASWSTASWSCESCSSDGSGDVSPTTASWSNVGWATNWG